MSQGNFNDGDQLSVVRTVLNDNADDAEARLDTLETYNPVGFINYNDLATATTPITALAGVPVKLTNDGAGAQTLKTYPPTGVTDLWDVSGQTMDFSEVNLGTIIHHRLDVTITITGANAEVMGSIKLGIGGFNYELNIFRHYFKTAGTYNITEANFIYIGDNNTRNNGGEFLIESSNNADIKVNGWALTAHLR